MSAVLVVNQALVDALLADPKFKAMMDSGELIIGTTSIGGKTLAGAWVDDLCRMGCISAAGASAALTQIMEMDRRSAFLWGDGPTSAPDLEWSPPVKAVSDSGENNRTARRKREAQERSRRPPRKARF